LAVTRDGLRFLLHVPVKPRERIRVLVNWLPVGNQAFSAYSMKVSATKL
jgi:hypothetical protein